MMTFEEQLLADVNQLCCTIARVNAGDRLSIVLPAAAYNALHRHVAGRISVDGCGGKCERTGGWDCCIVQVVSGVRVTFRRGRRTLRDAELWAALGKCLHGRNWGYVGLGCCEAEAAYVRDGYPDRFACEYHGTTDPLTGDDVDDPGWVALPALTRVKAGRW